MEQRVRVNDPRLKGPCGINNCPSTKYYKVDGRYVCELGHEQNIVETGEDEEAPAPSGVIRHTFTETSGEIEERKRKREEKLKPLSSDANALLYLQCYQFVLHGQVESLIKLGFPNELEGVVKDLWTLYLTALDVKIAENKKKRDKTTPEDDVGDDFDEVSEEEQSNNGDDITSQSNVSAFGRAYRSDIQVLKRYPLFIISPLFSYLAMVILRLPITLGNLFGWIKSSQIPYTRADKLIPPEMVRRLQGFTQFRFTINAKLDPQSLHYWARQLANFYSQEINITLPPLNHPPILFKLSTAMCFPLEMYSIATKLAALLDLKEFRIEGSRKHTGGYPEAKLMALLVVACKLGYELEKTPAWENWAIATEEEEQKDEGDAFNDVGEEDILGMSDEKLDEYMDWVQTGWIDDDDSHPGKKRIPDPILAMFPLVQPKESTALEIQAESSYLPLFPQPKNGPHTQQYTIYRPNATLPPVLHRIIQRAATVVGVHDNSLHYSIRWIEQNLNQRKQNIDQRSRS